MLTKAYVEAVYSPHKALVRMPLFNKIRDVNGSTPKSELPTATVCVVPGSEYDIEVGDIVFLGFEEDDLSKPVILGVLSRYDEKKSKINANLLELYVDNVVKLPRNTTIGSVNPDSIECLKGLSKDQNIRDKFVSLDTKDKEIDKSLENMKTTDSTINKNIDGINTNISEILSTQGTHSTQIEQINTDISGIKENYLKNDVLILKQAAFGNSFPQNGLVEGQLFFLSASSVAKFVKADDESNTDSSDATAGTT